MENKLPEGWEWKKLGEIAEINPKFDRKSLSENIEVTFLPMRCIEELTGNIDTSNIRNIAEVSKGYTPLMENDLLYAKITPCMENGKVAIAKGLKNNLGFASTEFHIIRLKKNAYNKFLFFYLIQKRIRERAALNMTGSAGQKRVPADFLNNLLVPLPSLETQQKIVSILEKAEEVKKLRAQADELTQKLLQSVFLEMFGDIAENPNKWNVRKIGDIAEVKTGGTPSRNIEGYWQNGTLPWVKTTEIKENIIYETEECITESGFQNSSASLLPQNSILIAMYGQGKTRGRTAKLGIQATTNQACAAILPSNKYDSNFLWSFLRLSYDALRNLGRGGNQPNLNLSMIKDFKIYFPPIEKQKIFSEIFENMEKTKQSQNQSSVEINNLFDALMQKAFTGELVL